MRRFMLFAWDDKRPRSGSAGFIDSYDNMEEVRGEVRFRLYDRYEVCDTESGAWIKL